MPTITPFLWFDNQAEEAAKFYTSIFRDSRIKEISHYTEAGPRPPGSVMVVTLELQGQELIFLNGGPEQKLSEAFSLFVTCDTQAEVDHYWARLSAGGEEVACGWLKDKYGVSWQVAPKILLEMLSDPDRTRAGRVMQAMLQMKKIEIKKLQDAYAYAPAR